MLIKLNRFFMSAIAVSALLATPAMSDEHESEMDYEPAELSESRQLLLDTATEDDFADREAARDALLDSQSQLDEAIADGADADIIDSLTAARDASEQTLDGQGDESQATHDAIAAMTDRQVRDTNRALNNARRNGTLVDLDAATLQDIADRDLSRRDIQSVTKALEEDAKFQRLASRFDQKYEETGQESFQRSRDRALAKGETQRDKFERKAGVREGAREEIRAEIRSESRSEAKNSARGNAKAEAKRLARESAREEAKRSGRSNGRGRN